MTVMILKVAYSEAKGVFLGVKDRKLVWSKDPGLTGDELAPTFIDREDFRRYLERELAGDTPVLGRDLAASAACRLQEVWPRREGGQVGVEEIANSGLPRWGNK